MSNRENPKATGAELAEITSGLVKLHHDFYGKGPTAAKSFAVDDAIICLLRGGLTTVEETLLADGRAEDVERVRRSFQQAMRDRFSEVVERAIDRKVIGYMSQVSADPQIAVEIFLLEPHPEKLLAGTRRGSTSRRADPPPRAQRRAFQSTSGTVSATPQSSSTRPT